MANGVILNGSLVYGGNNVVISESVVNLSVVVTGNGQNARKAYIAPTADTALPLGSVTTPCWLWVLNNDPTNYVTVKTGVAGTLIAKLRPGQFCLLPLDPSITAPSTQANTATCSIDYAILDL